MGRRLLKVNDSAWLYAESHRTPMQVAMLATFAVPEDRPRSRYALVRDVAVAASQALAERWPGMRLVGADAPVIRSLWHGGMRTCWSLPVELRR